MVDRNEDLEALLVSQLGAVEGVDIRAYDTVSSTMDVAKEWASEESLVNGKLRLVFAAKQSSGRGRRGRAWESAAEGVYCTIAARVAVSQEALAGLSLVVGIASMRMLEQIVPGACGLKWPNDVLAKDGRKLSGTLIETQSAGKGEQDVFIGIGVNCRGAMAEEIPACTLENLQSIETSPLAVCGMLVRELSVVLPRFFKNGFGIFRDEWLSRALYVNAEVSVTDNQQKISGVVSGIRTDGALELRTREGNRAVTVGDVQAL